MKRGIMPHVVTQAAYSSTDRHEAVSARLANAGTRDQGCPVGRFYRYGASPIHLRPVIGSVSGNR